MIPPPLSTLPEQSRQSIAGNRCVVKIGRYICRLDAARTHKSEGASSPTPRCITDGVCDILTRGTGYFTWLLSLLVGKKTLPADHPPNPHPPPCLSPRSTLCSSDGKSAMIYQNSKLAGSVIPACTAYQLPRPFNSMHVAHCAAPRCLQISVVNDIRT